MCLLWMKWISIVFWSLCCVRITRNRYMCSICTIHNTRSRFFSIFLALLSQREYFGVSIKVIRSSTPSTSIRTLPTEISLCTQCTLMNGNFYSRRQYWRITGLQRNYIYKSNCKQIHSFDDTPFPVVVYVHFGSCHVSFAQTLPQSDKVKTHWFRFLPIPSLASLNQSNYVEITHRRIAPKIRIWLIVSMPDSMLECYSALMCYVSLALRKHDVPEFNSFRRLNIPTSDEFVSIFLHNFKL